MIGDIKEFSLSRVKDTNILVFAYVGDSVYTTFIRSKLASVSYSKSGKLNSISNNIVNAKGQSLVLDYIIKVLNDDEIQIVKTARNAKTNNVAKHASLEDYKKATSLEALIGYLYLTNNTERLNKILNLCYEKVSENL